MAGRRGLFPEGSFCFLKAPGWLLGKLLWSNPAGVAYPGDDDTGANVPRHQEERVANSPFLPYKAMCHGQSPTDVATRGWGWTSNQPDSS